MSTNEEKISDITLDDVNKGIINAISSLKTATEALRCCYTGAVGDNQHYKNLRRSVTNNAIIYRNHIQPLAEKIIRNLKNFLDNYSELNYEQFTTFISDIASDAHRYRLQAELVARMHDSILTEFKKEEGRAVDVIQTLNLDAEKLRKDYENLKKSASDSGNTSFSALLAFIPAVTLSVMALPVVLTAAAVTTAVVAGSTRLYYDYQSGVISKDMATADNKKANLANVTEKVGGPLTESLKEFVNAMKVIAGFFNVLEAEIAKYSEDASRVASRVANEKSERHFTMMKSKAKSIQDSCQHYIAVLPDAKTDLDAINTEDIDWLYVQSWRTEIKVKINGEEKLFLDWVAEILPEMLLPG